MLKPSSQCFTQTDELLGFPTIQEESQSSSVQKRVTELLSGHSTLKSFVAGSVSGSCSTILFQPFDVLKTRLQTANTCTSSLSSTRLVPILSQVVKDQQIFGLWRGTTPSLLRCVPGVGLYFCSLDWLQTHFCKNSNGSQSQPSAIQAVSFGVIARSFAGAVLIPVTVVKTRYESGIFSYGSISQALRHTYVSEGARGLMSGLVPTLMRDAPFSGLYFMFYSQLRNLLIISSPSTSTSNNSISPILTFTCGLNAGLMASVVTHPMDVVKTRMQIYPKQFSSLISTVILITNERGFRGFFSGLLPRMMRRTLVAAMTWTVYEQLMKNVGLK